MDRLEGLKVEPDELEAAPPKAKTLLEGGGEVQVELAPGEAAVDISATTFESLGLNEGLLKGVYAMGFQKPSRIQAKALPLLMRTPYQLFFGVCFMLISVGTSTLSASHKAVRVKQLLLPWLFCHASMLPSLVLRRLSLLLRVSWRTRSLRSSNKWLNSLRFPLRKH